MTTNDDRSELELLDAQYRYDKTLPQECPICKGKGGWVSAGPMGAIHITCDRCDGTGEVAP